MENRLDDIKRLQGCLNDLISLLALPALWTGRKPSQMVRTLLDGLVGMLRLDFAYARLSDLIQGEPSARRGQVGDYPRWNGFRVAVA